MGNDNKSNRNARKLTFNDDNEDMDKFVKAQSKRKDMKVFRFDSDGDFSDFTTSLILDMAREDIAIYTRLCNKSTLVVYFYEKGVEGVRKETIDLSTIKSNKIFIRDNVVFAKNSTTGSDVPIAITLDDQMFKSEVERVVNSMQNFKPVYVDKIDVEDRKDEELIEPNVDNGDNNPVDNVSEEPKPIETPIQTNVEKPETVVFEAPVLGSDHPIDLNIEKDPKPEPDVKFVTTVAKSPAKKIESIDIYDMTKDAPAEKNIKVTIHEDSEYDNRLTNEFGMSDDGMGDVPPEDFDMLHKAVDSEFKSDDSSNYKDLSELKDIKVDIDYGSGETADNSGKSIEKMNELVKSSINKRFKGVSDPNDRMFRMLLNKKTDVISRISEEIDTSNINPKKIGTDDLSTASFLSKQVGPLMKPDVAIVPLLVSGLVVNISAFMYYDLIKIRQIIPEFRTRNASARNAALLKKRKLEIETIYDHIVCVQGYSQKPSYDEFLNMVLLPDLAQLFFGTYLATYNHEQTYEVTCMQCGNSIEVNKSPKDLCYILSENIDYNDAKKIIRGTMPSEKIADIPLVKYSKKEYVEKKPLPKSGIIIHEKIPTLKDYIEGIEILNDVYSDRDLNDIDFTSLYVRNMEEEQPIEKFLRACLYINQIVVPDIDINDGGQHAKTTFYSTTDKGIIYETLSKLHADDFNAIVTSENIDKMMSIKGIQHYIKLDECPNCHIQMEPFHFNSELIFFLEM